LFHENNDALNLLVYNRSSKYIIENDKYGLSEIYYKLHHYLFILKHFKEIREIKTLTLDDIISDDFIGRLTMCHI
jgi:hypothetical protein